MKINKKQLSFIIICAVIAVVAITLVIVFTTCAPTPEEEIPTLSTEYVNLKTGEQKTITVENAGENEIVWESTNTTVATVDNGVITALSAGNATINVKVGKYEFTVAVKVDMIEATVLILDSNGIKSEDYKTALYLNQTYTFTPYLIKGGEMIALDGITIEYQSSNKTVATVEADGKAVKVSAKTVGKTNVWASCEYQGETYTSRKIEVTVKNSTELVLSQTSFTFVTSEDLQGNPVQVGATGRVYVSYRKLDTNEIIPVSKNDITFKIEDGEIATVDSWGNLMGKSGGTTKLKIETEFGEGEVDIAVSYPIYSAIDLDTLALATYNMSMTKATKFLSETFVLMNDIDYNTHTRNYMLPIASLNANDSANLAGDLYLDRDTQRPGEEYGSVSYYSKAWKEILNLTEGTEHFTVTSDTVHEDASENNPVTIQAKRLYKQNGDAFEGINPNGIKFTGVLDGNGYSIKNAWLMLDNYLMSMKELSQRVGVIPAYMSGFIGYQAGTVKNLAFENLGIGDTNTLVNNGKYSHGTRIGAGKSYTGTIGAMYTGPMNDDVNNNMTDVQTTAINQNSRNGECYYTERVVVSGKEKVASFKRGMVLFAYKNDRESGPNALFLKNEGTIENIKMSYIATGTHSDINNCVRADGFVLVNDGAVKNSIVERIVYEGAYAKKPQKGRMIYLNRANGSIDNVYLTTNGIGNELPYNTKGTYDVTECTSSNLLASTVSKLDTNVWNGAYLIKGCALRV